MSSTNRSNKRYEHVNDYYVTPTFEVYRFLHEYNKVNEIDKNIKVLDCCAGGDTEHSMSYPTALGTFGIENVTTVDIREDSLAEIKCDYLNTPMKGYDLIISNPPFKIAMEFIKKALDDLEDGGKLIFLLRLNFLGSKARFEFLKQQMPKEIFVHHKRMSFTDDGKTDSIEYAHFVWEKGFKGDTKLYLI